MDSNYWSKLPDDIVNIILLYLPTYTLLHLRRVCKKWKTLIDSNTFLALHDQICINKGTPWLLMFSKQQDLSFCPVFDSFRYLWGNLSFSFLRASRVFEVLAVCQGLICFRADPVGVLIVCNPVTRAWRKLPPSIDYAKRPLVSMGAEPHSNTFRVIIAGSGSSSFNTNTELYDSSTNSWKRIANLPLRKELRSEAPYCDGNFYFTASEPPAILSYNVETDAWTQLAAPLPDSLTYATTAISEGMVFLIIGTGVHGITRSLSIWHLQKNTMDWQEVQKMPEIMCKKFLSICYHTYKHICCIGHEDSIFMFCLTSPELVEYRISSGTWHWLPQCPFLSGKKSGGFSWFSLKPSLWRMI